MKRTFLVLTLVAAMVAMAGIAYADDEAVTVGVGNMKIGGILQSGLIFYVGNEYLESGQAMDIGKDFEFYYKRARLLISGSVIDERVTYFTQFEFAHDSNAHMGDILLDAKLGFHYIPYTGIYVGRMLPKFTFFGPRSTAMLCFIDYPLMNRWPFAVQRQTGIDFGVKTTFLDANLGLFNGRSYNTALVAPNATTPVGNVNWNDQNTGKDFYIGLVGKPPVEGLKVFAGLWYGTPLDGWEAEDGELTEHNATAMMIDAGAAYMAPFGLTFIGELLYATYSWDSTDPASNFENDRADDTYELTTMSYYVMAGYNFNPLFEVPVEVLLRYDSLDPDTENDDEVHAGSETDGLYDFTFGVNYYIKKYYAMLSLNYIYHGEEWEDIIPLDGDTDNLQDGISNDEIKIQAQIAF